MSVGESTSSVAREHHARTVAGLEPYSGPWDVRAAAHLLRRTRFGANRAEILAATRTTLPDVISTLLEDKPAPDRPIDPTTGTTWLDSAFNSDNDSRYFGYLRAWWMGLIVQESTIREKMVLFWHNHFATEASTVNDSRFMYRQNALLRQYSLGNIRDFVRAVTIDPAMLYYLNGYRSRGDGNSVPDENYARELQELFTIGKGPQRGADDYTNYTEADVKSAARVLAGWQITGYRSTTTATIGSSFESKRHDIRDKVFSPAYQNTVIKGSSDGQREMNDLLEMIFRQEETARFLCRRLYRWFVFYDIDELAEQNVIEPLAVIMRNSGYEVRPVLSALFGSAHFFDAENQGAQIKNPVDLTAGALRTLNIAPPSQAAQSSAWYSLMASLRTTASNLQMNLLDPPAVAGWEPYRQTPEFYRLWLNTVTLPTRWGFTDAVVNGLRFGTVRVAADAIALAYQTSNPADPYKLVDELGQLLFAARLTTAQVDRLVLNVLLPGLPDYEWPVEWFAYVADPANSKVRDPILNKLNALLKYMLRMAEFQLT
jgi:uncharacterized protein (DUF1800 family)